MASDSFAAGLVGIVLDGRYRLDALLGEGGMGAVFRAHHLAMDRRVAVKLLKPHLTSDDAALQRFAREARSTLKVDSPHAVKVLDFGVTPHRDYYMVLEYLDGRTVQRELDVDGPFAPRRVLHIARQALHALGAAHASGLIHRDIKPDNILLMRVDGDPDYAKLLDFGVAKLMEGAATSDRSALALTQQGMVFGTPEFMSPEQACGQALDPRSDLYSLAATMFAMLTGCGMYPAKSALEWLTHHARTPAPRLSDALASLAGYPELDAVLQQCLAKRREQRPATADAMAQLLATTDLMTDPVLATATERPTTPSKAMRPARSSFIAALPEAALDPGATLLPGAQLPGSTATPTTGVVAATRNRHGKLLAAGALAIVAMIVAAVVVASRNHPRSEPPATLRSAGSAEGWRASTDAPAAPEPDAAIVAFDSAPARPIDAGVPHPPSIPHPSNEAARHIAAAEDAQRQGKWLIELSEADAALAAEPHNVRAHLLAADAELRSGDLDHGCKYLRDLGKNPIAQARARQAGCPGD